MNSALSLKIYFSFCLPFHPNAAPLTDVLLGLPHLDGADRPETQVLFTVDDR